MTAKQRAELIAKVAARFHTFGGGRVTDPSNPISHWTKNDAAAFAMGVDVGEVVDFVEKELRRHRRKTV